MHGVAEAKFYQECIKVICQVSTIERDQRLICLDSDMYFARSSYSQWMPKMLVMSFVNQMYALMTTIVMKQQDGQQDMSKEQKHHGHSTVRTEDGKS